MIRIGQVKKVRPELTIESSTQGQCYRERERNEYTIKARGKEEWEQGKERRERGPEYTYTHIGGPRKQHQ